MTRLTAARERLENAVARLDAAMRLHEDAVARNAALSDEIASLRSDYDKLQGRNATLRQRTDQVSVRLDRAIGTLRAVVGE